MSDIVPKNTLKEQPGKEMRILKGKGTVVQLKECIKILERYNQQNCVGISEGAAQISFHIHRERKHLFVDGFLNLGLGLVLEPLIQVSRAAKCQAFCIRCVMARVQY